MKEKFEKILRNEGYVPKRDDDGDIIVKFQGVTFLIMAEDNISFGRVWLPKFWSLDSSDEYAKACWVANRLNKEYRVGKIVIDDELKDTHCLAEFFIDKDDVQFQDIFLRMFDILFSMRREFAELMNQSNENLIQLTR